MALENLKFYKIKLDRADMTITQVLKAKEGAVNGNGIELQVINGSIVEDTTDVAVYLNWRHTITDTQGSEPFTLVDAASGVYRVSYPTEMLIKGTVLADIKLVDPVGVTISAATLMINIAESATDTETQSANAWNDIQQILVDTQIIKSQFNQVLAGATVDGEVIAARNAFTTLGQRLDTTDTQLANKVEKVEGKGLSTEDYTTEEKAKVGNLPLDTNAKLADKVDKIAGKGLSTEDYTTSEKGKVANIPLDTNAQLAQKANQATTYTKTEVDNALALKANKAQEAWITPTLLNGWVGEAGYPIGYYKDTMGIVRLRGRIKNGPLVTPAFVFPIGYRPSSSVSVPSIGSGGSVGFLQVNVMGQLQQLTGTTVYQSLDAISFKAEG